jgi:anti-anti-sigma factor
MAIRQSNLFSLVVEESNDTLLLRLTGAFELIRVGAVENVLDRLSHTPAPTRVVFDLQELTYLDLAGLETILRTDKRGRAKGFEVVVIRPRQRTPRRVFAITRAGDQLTMTDTLETA